MNTEFPIADILLVEDNPTDAELTIRSLKKQNLVNHIDWVKDGEEALEYLFESKHPRPKVVLLDLRLPKVDGIEVLRAIRESEHLSNLTVIIMTSSGEEIDLMEAHGLHVNSYVRKPIEFAEFSKVVADVGMYWLLINQAPPNHD